MDKTQKTILYVNWSPLWEGEDMGGGVNVYVNAMAVEMAKRGYQVISISSGWAYNFAGGPYLKRGPDFKNTINYFVVNAPNIAPGFLNYVTPLDDIRELQVESIFAKLIQHLQPDIVHFNNIEGFSAHCISIARDFGARVIYSLHNYHTVCNQVYLLYQDQQICQDFDQGNKCLSCIHPPSKKFELLKRKFNYLSQTIPEGKLLYDTVQSFSKFMKTVPISLKAVRSILKSRKERLRSIGVPIDVLQPPLRLSNSSKEFSSTGATASHYAQRRSEVISALNRAHLVLAVSNWVKQTYQRMGINEKQLKVSHIGSAIAQIGLQQTVDEYHTDVNKPLKIVFLGISSLPKGLPFLLNTLLKMDYELLSKIKLYIYARGIGEHIHLLNSLSTSLASLHFTDGYKYEDIPILLKGMDAGIVPPIWWDNAPQVVFEMLAFKVPVIGTRIGGIPDFVRHQENGLLFESGDSKDLICQLKRVITQPDFLNRYRKAITPMKTITQHGDELEKYYNFC